MVVHCGQSFLAPYSASKAALANVTKNSAQALRRHRIRVNGINCGWMDTPGEDAIQRKYHGAGDDWLEKAEAAQPFGTLVKPAQVARLAAYMLGPASGVMTGASWISTRMSPGPTRSEVRGTHDRQIWGAGRGAHRARSTPVPWPPCRGRGSWPWPTRWPKPRGAWPTH